MKNKKINKTSLITVLLAVLGVCLLVVGGIGGARAALTESDDFTAEMTTQTIKVELYEKSGQTEEPVRICDSSKPEEVGTLLKDLKTLPVGEPYNEELTVKNTGSADAFVRITVYKYWTNDEGKQVELDPQYIKLTFGEGWVEDEAARTTERTVLYYTNALKPNDTTKAAITKIAASSGLSKLVKQDVKETGGRTVITSTYKYDGLNLNLEASVDAIQTHNAQEAIKADWGVNVTANETTLSLN